MKHNKLLKGIFTIGFAIPLATIFPLSSCGLSHPWDWKSATKNNTEINYCLLIGQNEHTESIERTRGTRKALDTYDAEATKKVKDNANIAEPKLGHFDLTNPKTGETLTLPVREIEHMEQKSITGAAWDPITANATTGTWIAKHGNNITFFVANNDALAEGAMWASNWIKGMPIFGYDANSTTLQWVNSGQITGTVDQNPSSQAAIAMLMFRNFLEDRDKYWANGCKPSKDNHWFGADPASKGDHYTPLWCGVHTPETKPDPEEKYGYVNQKLFTTVDLIDPARQVLADCTPIAKLEGVEKFNNIGQFIKEDGTAKQPSDMFDQFTYIKKDAKPSKKYKICHTYSNKSEAFLVATMRPYYNEYASRVGLDLSPVEGDGTDETLVLNEISSRPNDFDGYFICMAKTTTALQYVQACAPKAFKYEKDKVPGRTWKDGGWDKWEDRLDTPLFFWIRHPTKDDGSIDQDVLNNKYFKYTYYIGANSQAGGSAQGRLIDAAIKKWYYDWVMKE